MGINALGWARGFFSSSPMLFQIFSEFERPMDYHDANIFCRENQHATLPTIPSLAVQDFLYSFVSNTNSNIWLGMVCGNQHFDSCRWWYDTPNDGKSPPYINFYGSAPNSDGGPIMMLANGGQWNNASPWWPWVTAVVCEKPARMWQWIFEISVWNCRQIQRGTGRSLQPDDYFMP